MQGRLFDSDGVCIAVLSKVEHVPSTRFEIGTRSTVVPAGYSGTLHFVQPVPELMHALKRQYALIKELGDLAEHGFTPFEDHVISLRHEHEDNVNTFPLTAELWDGESAESEEARLAHSKGNPVKDLIFYFEEDNIFIFRIA